MARKPIPRIFGACGETSPTPVGILLISRPANAIGFSFQAFVRTLLNSQDLIICPWVWFFFLKGSTRFPMPLNPKA